MSLFYRGPEFGQPGCLISRGKATLPQEPNQQRELQLQRPQVYAYCVAGRRCAGGGSGTFAVDEQGLPISVALQRLETQMKVRLRPATAGSLIPLGKCSIRGPNVRLAFPPDQMPVVLHAGGLLVVKEEHRGHPFHVLIKAKAGGRGGGGPAVSTPRHTWRRAAAAASPGCRLRSWLSPGASPGNMRPPQ